MRQIGISETLFCRYTRALLGPTPSSSPKHWVWEIKDWTRFDLYPIVHSTCGVVEKVTHLNRKPLGYLCPQPKWGQPLRPLSGLQRSRSLRWGRHKGPWTARGSQPSNGHSSWRPRAEAPHLNEVQAVSAGGVKELVSMVTAQTSTRAESGSVLRNPGQGWGLN